MITDLSSTSSFLPSSGPASGLAALGTRSPGTAISLKHWKQLVTKCNPKLGSAHGVMLGCAVSLITCAKHGCTGGWLEVCRQCSDWCWKRSPKPALIYAITVVSCHQARHGTVSKSVLAALEHIHLLHFCEYWYSFNVHCLNCHERLRPVTRFRIRHTEIWNSQYTTITPFISMA